MWESFKSGVFGRGLGMLKREERGTGSVRAIQAVGRRVAVLREDDRSLVLAAIAIGWGVSIGVRLVYPALLPQLRSWFGLNLTVAGMLVSVLWVVYAIGQLPGGLLADRYGERVVLGASLVLGSVSLVFVVSAGSIGVLFVATGVFAVVSALFAVPRVTVLAGLYPERMGSAIGVSMAAGDIGNTVLPPIAALVAAVTLWQVGFGMWIPLLLVTGLVVYRIVPAVESPRQSQMVSLGLVRLLVTELRRRVILQTLVVVVFAEITWHSFTAFYPTYLVEIKGLHPAVAASLFGLFFACGSVVKLIAGGAYDRAGVRGSLPVVMGIATIGLVLLPLVDGFWPIVGVTVLISWFLGSYTVTLAYLTKTLTAEIQGSGLGLIRSIYIMIGATSPIGVGILADHGYFDVAFWVVACVLGVAVVLTLTLPPASAQS